MKKSIKDIKDVYASICYASICTSVRESVCASVYAFIYDSVWNPVYNSVDTSVWFPVNNTIKGEGEIE